MADYAGVSVDTASKYKKVMQSDNEEIKKEVKAGEKSINKAYKEMKGGVNTEVINATKKELEKDEHDIDLLFATISNYLDNNINRINYQDSIGLIDKIIIYLEEKKNV